MSTFEKHLAAINRGEVTRSNIIGMRKAFNAWDRASRGYSVSRTSPAITTAQADAAFMAMSERQPTVTGELHESGLKVLRNPRYRSRWTERQQGIIDRLDHFKLIRFDWIGSRQAHCVPVFKAVDATGQSFAFRNIPWQSAWSLGEEDGPRVVSEHG